MKCTQEALLYCIYVAAKGSHHYPMSGRYWHYPPPLPPQSSFHCHISLLTLNIKSQTKKWTLFRNNVDTTIRKYSSRAFIWVASPLDFVTQFRIYCRNFLVQSNSHLAVKVHIQYMFVFCSKYDFLLPLCFMHIRCAVVIVLLIIMLVWLV